MNAIKRLYRAGLSRAEIADGIGCDPQLVGMYERNQRWPGRRNFACIVELAEARGIDLRARDFLAANDVCEPDTPARGKKGT